MVFFIGKNYGEITPVHYFFSEFAALLDEPFKLRVQFRCAAGNIHRGNAGSCFDDMETNLKVLPGHIFPGFIGAGIYMAMAANLVA